MIGVSQPGNEAVHIHIYAALRALPSGGLEGETDLVRALHDDVQSWSVYVLRLHIRVCCVGKSRCDTNTFIWLQIQFLPNVTIAASRHDLHSEWE